MSKVKSFFKKPKKPDTRKQEALLAEQQASLEKQRQETEAEANRLRDVRIAQQRRLRGRLSGRQSLIATSELGVTGKLGE